MVFEIGPIAFNYLIATLAVGLFAIVNIHPRSSAPMRSPFWAWSWVFASWVMTLLVNDNLTGGMRFLSLGVMDGFLVTLFARRAFDRKYAWLAILALVHVSMTVLHFFGHALALGNHQLIYNYHYIAALLSVFTASGAPIARILDNIVFAFSDRWSFANPRARPDGNRA